LPARRKHVLEAADAGPMIIGIDLGTTNSLVGIWRDGAVTPIPNSDEPHPS
jgi:molecular chaperone DnaK (HSP70)